MSREGFVSSEVSPVNATNKRVTYGSNNTGVATVNQAGLVVARYPGKAEIRVTTEESQFVDICDVTVSAINRIPVNGITLNKTSTTISLLRFEYLIPIISPANASNQEVVWSSSNPNIVEILAPGQIYGKATGVATVTVRTVDGNHTATCSVTVSAVHIPVESVSISPSVANLTV